MRSIHGYNFSSDYTQKFYRELSPDWIDIALISTGLLPPRARNTTDQFNYLELGCGMGLTLTFLAAFYPEGRFVGIDYSASHVAKARHFASHLGIDNIRFIQADLVKVARDPGQYRLKQEAFDYVIAHGLMTWVAKDVQHAALQLTEWALACGGAFFSSYNCLPGWLSASILQHTYKIFSRQESNNYDPNNPYLQSREYLTTLLKSGDHGESPLQITHPSLQDWVDFIDKQDPSYIQHEFGHDQWHPVYSGDFHRQASKYQLTYASSCSYSDNLKELLPTEIRTLLSKMQEPCDRQSIEDISCNRSFRRDIFIKGPLSISGKHSLDLLEPLELFLIRPAKLGTQINLNSPLGRITANSNAYEPILEFLIHGNRCFADLFSQLQISKNDCLNRVLLLLDEGIIGISASHRRESWPNYYHTLNGLISHGSTEGFHCGYLMAPKATNVAPIDIISSVILSGLHKNQTEQDLVSYVKENLQDLGGKFQDENGDRISCEDDIRLFIAGQINEFLSKKLPYLRHLGAFA